MDHLEAETEALEELNNDSGADSLEREFARLEKPAGNTDRMLEEIRKKVALEDTRGVAASGSGDTGDRSAGPPTADSTARHDAASGTTDVDEALEELKRKVKAEPGT